VNPKLRPLKKRRPDHILRDLGRAFRVAARFTPVFGCGYAPAVRRAARLMGRELFTVEEILRLGLLDPALSTDDLRRFTSRRAMTLIEQRLNPEAWRVLAEDKGIFYRYCAAHGLPTPPLWALFMGERPGWARGRPAPDSREAWCGFLESNCPAGLVIKPGFGGYGSGVQVFERTPDKKFVDHTHQALGAAELVDRLYAGAGIRGWVIQERIHNHPDLRRLSGSPYLQCARLITLSDRQGQPHLLHAHLKVIVGGNAIDNFHHGATGNVTARADLERGTLFAAMAGNPHGAGYLTASRHPDTGEAIEGFQLPFWNEACQLAKTAAREFLPLRFVGWDIALTANGPVVVEANWNPDPTNPHRNLHLLRAKIEQLA
jgi:hypothetical protein